MEGVEEGVVINSGATVNRAAAVVVVGAAESAILLKDRSNK